MYKLLVFIFSIMLIHQVAVQEQSIGFYASLAVLFLGTLGDHIHFLLKGFKEDSLLKKSVGTICCSLHGIWILVSASGLIEFISLKDRQIQFQYYDSLVFAMDLHYAYLGMVLTVVLSACMIFLTNFYITHSKKMEEKLEKQEGKLTVNGEVNNGEAAHG